MSAPKKLAIRLAIYLAFVSYLLLDLFVFKGPLYNGIAQRSLNSPEAKAAAQARGIVARVYGQPIYQAQVDERVREFLWRQGREPEETSLAERRFLQHLVRKRLIDERLIKVQIKVSPPEDFALPTETVAKEVDLFEQRFDDPEALSAALENSGWQGQKELRYRVAARLQQERYLEEMIALGAQPDLARAREWYEQNKAKLTRPALYQARHIFVSSLNKTPEQGRQRIRDAQKALTASAFAEVASRFSEDPRSASAGGELGWISQDDLPKGMEIQLGDLGLNQAHLLKSSLGWHLLEVLEISPAEVSPFSELAPQIQAALAVQERREALEKLLKTLRHREADKIKIYPIAPPSPAGSENRDATLPGPPPR